MNNQSKKISVLGSTGSVGRQALDVARKCGYTVTSISAMRDAAGVEAQAREFGVRCCALADKYAASDLKVRLADTDIRVFSGEEGICEMIEEDSSEVALNAIMGKAGLLPTLSVIKSKKRLALANKESLVAAGEIVMRTAQENGVEIIPVDSEHSAIFQCLKSGKDKEIKRIILTASGGPFFGYSKERLAQVTRESALAHPTWQMGAKITIDSATLMNKGLEVIEASHLFGVGADRIGVLVHRESIIHSMVEYIDNSVISQMSVPDMRLCVQYAVSYPERTAAVIPELDFVKIPSLTFCEPDADTFVLLRTAYDCLAAGGALPAALNAANEVAVEGFLAGKITFPAIAETVLSTLARLTGARNLHTLDEILETDLEARKIARTYIP